MNRRVTRNCILFFLILIFTLTPSVFSTQKKIRIGVVSMITPVDSVKYYQALIDYMSEKLGMPVEMVYRKSYDEMDRMLENREVEAAFICSAPYVEDRRKFGAELLVVPQVNGSVLYKSYIIVHKDSTINSFDELEGKTFALTDPKSNSGRLYPFYRLAKEGKSPDDFFKKYIYSYSHNKSVELVAKKVVDGAAVENLVYEYMKKDGSPYVKKTRIIERSKEFGIPPVVTTPHVSTFIKEKMKEILMNMHLDRKGKKILSAMLTDKFVEGSDSDYDSVREMESFVSIFNFGEDINQVEANTITIGLIPRDNPRIAYEKYQPIIDYLSENTHYDFELVLRKTYENTVNALGNGDIDIAFLGPLTYLHARAEFGAISILKSVTEKGETHYRSVILTRDDLTTNNLSELKGKDFAFASLQSTSGNLVPRLLLAEDGIHLKELRTYRNFNYHDTVVKWVLRGRYHAGAVRESVAEKYKHQGVKIISVSGPIPTGPVVVGPNTPYTVVEIVKKTLIDMNKTEKGKDILKKVDADLRGGFVEASDSDYQHIRTIVNQIPTSCGIGCHPKLKL